MIDYDDGFNYLQCTKCGAKYKAIDLEKAVEDNIVIERGNERSNKIMIEVKSGWGENLVTRTTMDNYDPIEAFAARAIRKPRRNGKPNKVGDLEVTVSKNGSKLKTTIDPEKREKRQSFQVKSGWGFREDQLPPLSYPSPSEGLSVRTGYEKEAVAVPKKVSDPYMEKWSGLVNEKIYTLIRNILSHPNKSDNDYLCGLQITHNDHEYFSIMRLWNLGISSEPGYYYNMVLADDCLRELASSTITPEVASAISELIEGSTDVFLNFLIEQKITPKDIKEVHYIEPNNILENIVWKEKNSEDDYPTIYELMTGELYEMDLNSTNSVGYELKIDDPTFEYLLAKVRWEEKGEEKGYHIQIFDETSKLIYHNHFVSPINNEAKIETIPKLISEYMNNNGFSLIDFKSINPESIVPAVYHTKTDENIIDEEEDDTPVSMVLLSARTVSRDDLSEYEINDMKEELGSAKALMIEGNYSLGKAGEGPYLITMINDLPVDEYTLMAKEACISLLAELESNKKLVEQLKHELARVTNAKLIAGPASIEKLVAGDCNPEYGWKNEDAAVEETAVEEETVFDTASNFIPETSQNPDQDNSSDDEDDQQENGSEEIDDESEEETDATKKLEPLTKDPNGSNVISAIVESAEAINGVRNDAHNGLKRPNLPVGAVPPTSASYENSYQKYPASRINQNANRGNNGKGRKRGKKAGK